MTIGWFGRKYLFVAGIAVLLAVGVGPPAGATNFTKLYKFTNTTGTSQTSVCAITNGFEVITYTSGMPSGWIPATVGGAVLSGVYCTTLTYGGYGLGNGKEVTIGWVTADGSCRLRDLRWGGGESVVPTQVRGIPGGGLVFYDYPNPGDLTVVITNDNLDPAACLALGDVNFAISGTELDLAQLDQLASEGLVELRVAAIDHDISVLAAEVEYYLSLGEIKAPDASSLLGKLSRAADLKEQGLSEYLAGDSNRALFHWGKAAQQITNFISQVTTMSAKANLPASLYTRWIVDGGGEIKTAPEILDALLALPNGQPLESLSPLPSGTPLPNYAGLEGMVYQPWPVDTLCPGEYTAFVVPRVSLGSGFIMQGSLVDAAGNPVLLWIEQGAAEPEIVDTEPPVITGVSVSPDYLWPPDHAMIQMTLNVTVSDNVGAVWYIESVTSNQPDNGSGDGDCSPDWLLDPQDPQSLQLRRERSGSDPTEVRLYTVTLRAMDMAGNLSAPYSLVIPVDHDQG